MNWRIFDRIRVRKRAYEHVLLGAPGTANYEFLTDMARFCRAFDHTPARKADGSVDVEMNLIWIGYRMVWDRIQQHLHLEPEQIAALYGAVVEARIGEHE